MSINHPHTQEALAAAVKKWTGPGENGCIVWTGEFNQFGTSNIRVTGAILDAIKVVWWLKHGYKPRWKHMVQKCKTKNCMNPDHFIDNTPLKLRKTKLVEKIVPTFSPEEDAELYERHKEGESMRELAEAKYVNVMTMHRAITRHRRIIGELKPQTYREKMSKKVSEIIQERRFLWGETEAAIAKDMGISKMSVRMVIRAFHRRRKKNKKIKTQDS